LLEVTRYGELNLDQPERLPCHSKRNANIPTSAELQVGGTATSA